MPILAWLYEKVKRRPASHGLRDNSIPMIIWKMIRKWLCQSVIPFMPLNCTRIWGYRLVGFKIGKRVFIGMRVYMDDSYPSNTVIEDDVVVSYQVTFAAHGPRMKNHKIVLKERCYIGVNVTILGGTVIGYCATVGACSLVTRDVPPFTVVVGVPARVIGGDRTPWGNDEHRLEEWKRKYLGPEAGHADEDQAQSDDKTP
jgi:acetyltransferase-like isoleucine patch superfamily enzyme